VAVEPYPPGPRLPPLLQAAAVARDAYGFMRKRNRRYGDIFSSRFPFFGRVVYVADPEEVKRIFAGDPAVFHAGEANASVLGDPLGKHSLLTLDDDAHMSQRKLLLPPFHGERVRRHVELMATATANEVASWPTGQPFALRPCMQRITLEVILRAVFGVRDGERMDRFREAIPRIADATGALDFLPVFQRELGPWSPAARFRRALEAADKLIYEEIALRRAEGGTEQRDDVLSLLLSARHEDGSPMTDVELRDELMTLLTAGHETTATGLSWTFERLVRTPRVLERLTSDLDDDAYLDAVVKESLRSRPVVMDVARLLTRETEIAGYRLPARTIVLAAIAAMHARPQAYPDWEAFRPERFIDQASQPYTWIPFGGGVRRCIGAAFAQVEMRVVLREVLQRVRLRADRPRAERPRVKHVTVVPARGARVVVTERLALDDTGAAAQRVPAIA
jgi:cytochrome P450